MIFDYVDLFSFGGHCAMLKTQYHRDAIHLKIGRLLIFLWSRSAPSILHEVEDHFRSPAVKALRTLLLRMTVFAIQVMQTITPTRAVSGSHLVLMLCNEFIET